MSDSRVGIVWCERRRVGRIWSEDDRTIRFAYESSWLASGFAISASIPLEEGELDAHEFFAGLLPEGVARQRVCRQYRLREDDDLGLLLAIGRDCAGALSVLPENETLGEDEAPIPIGDQDLARLVQTQGQALPAAAERPRFSLAGAQHKLAVCIDDSGMWLPTWTRPSSHILKFETARWICCAEWAANDLARSAGLRVPALEFRRHSQEPAAPYLVVERYDRVPDAHGSLRRLHQEDATQALGISGLLKYEEHGGPGLGPIATLVRRHSSDPIRDVTSLRDWQIFNYLAGNSDGHAKNLALLYPTEGSVPSLAPFYDLVCIEFLNRLGMHYDRKLALFIGAHHVPEQVTRDDWALFARALGVPPKPLLERLRQLATDLPALSAATRERFANEHGDSQALEYLEESIRDRCKWTLASVFGKG